MVDRFNTISESSGDGAMVLVNDDFTIVEESVNVNYSISNPQFCEWEIGTGTLSNMNALTRSAVIASSNSNAFVTFSGGIKTVEVILISPAVILPNLPSLAVISQNLSQVVKQYMDDKVAERRYDSILSACSYISSDNPKYQAEAEACNKFRTACWEVCEKLEEEVLSGLRQVPTKEDVISELPVLVWPE